RRESLHQSQVYRGAGGNPSLRWVQHERDRFEGRRARLSRIIPASEGDRGAGGLETDRAGMSFWSEDVEAARIVSAPGRTTRPRTSLLEARNFPTRRLS